MGCVTLLHSPLWGEATKITGQSLRNKEKLSQHAHMLKHYTSETTNLWIVKLYPKVDQASLAPDTSLNQLHWVLKTPSKTASFILDALKDTRADSCRDHGKTCAMDKFPGNHGEALDLVSDSPEWALEEDISWVDGQIGSTISLLSEPGQRPTDSLAMSLENDASDNERADAEAHTINTLLTKLWIVWQNLSFISVPANGADDSSRRQQSCQQGGEHRVRGQVSSKLAQKRPSQLPESPESDEDRDPKRPEIRKLRGRDHRFQNEFGCPYFKHDPEKHGGRSGCRVYSHKSVSILLRDHIRTKHLRNSDLDAAMWQELKTTRHLKGAERYKAIYAKLFPGDSVGIRNPYFDEYNAPPSWHQSSHLLQNATSMNAAVECLDSFQRLEQERVEREAQIRRDAEVELSQAQTDLEAQMKPLQAAANERERQIRILRDEKLEEVGAEITQRRQAIRARMESTIFGQAGEPSRTTDITSPMDLAGVASNETNYISTSEAVRPLPAIADSASNINGRSLPISNTQFLAESEPHLTGMASAIALQDTSWLESSPQVDRVRAGLWHPDQDQTQPGPSSLHLTDDGAFSKPGHVCCGCCGQDHAVFCFECMGAHC